MKELSLTEWCVDLKYNDEFQRKLATNKSLYVSYFITESISEEKSYGKKVYPRHGHSSYLILCEPKYMEQLFNVLGNKGCNLWHSSPHIVLLKSLHGDKREWYLENLHCLIMSIDYLSPLDLNILPSSMKDDKHVQLSWNAHFRKLLDIEKYLNNYENNILAYFTTYTEGEMVPKTERFYIFLKEDSLQRAISTLSNLDFDSGREDFLVFNYKDEEIHNDNLNPELRYLSSEHSIWRAVDGENLISYESPYESFTTSDSASSNVESQKVFAHKQEEQKIEQKKENMIPIQPAKNYGMSSISKAMTSDKQSRTKNESQLQNVTVQQPSAIDKIDKIFDRLGMVVTIIVALSVGLVFFYTCHGPTSKVEKAQSYSSTVHYTDYGDKLPEMISSFSAVYAENPNSFVLQSVNWKKPDVLILNINSNWYAVSKEQKKATIESAMKIWNGMAGARGIHVNVDEFEVHVVDPSSGKKVAKWGSVMGTQIDD